MPEVQNDIARDTSGDASASRIGVLLMNLGTPDAPRFWPVRRYLAEFLGDPLVIDLPRLPWLLLLYGVILNIRPFKTAAAYRKVWTDNGSPLLVHTNSIARKLEHALNESDNDRYIVETGMRYGTPSLIDGVKRLRARGAERLILLPLYPQYSHTTTTTSFKVVDTYTAMEHKPSSERVGDYHDEPAYIDTVADKISTYWQQNGRGDHLLISFHGLPQRYIDNGDPYRDQCATTARRIANRLELANHQWTLCYQSRVGREEWLRPYTIDVAREKATNGTAKLDVVCPGFPADCLETLEEIALGLAEDFCHHGGGALRYIPGLNDDPAHVAMLCQLILDKSEQSLSCSGLRDEHGVARAN